MGFTTVVYYTTGIVAIFKAELFPFHINRLLAKQYFTITPSSSCRVCKNLSTAKFRLKLRIQFHCSCIQFAVFGTFKFPQLSKKC